MRSLALLLVPPVLLACGDASQSTAPKIEPEVARSALQRNTNPSVPPGDLQTAVADDTAFALEVYGHLRAAGGNVFFSPYSISSALAMTYAGARGTTATEIAQTMHFTLPDARLHAAFDALDLALTGPAAAQGDFVLHVSNALWGQRGTNFLAPFLDTLAVNYGAGMNLLDFIHDPNGGRQTINAYVAQETNDLIPELLPDGTVTVDTRLVLTNVIYFKADWVEAFEKEATAAADFHALDGTTVRTDMMHGIVPAKYARLAGYDALSLPYKGDQISMLILAPAAGTLAAFEAGLTPALLDTTVAALAPAQVKVALPRFGLDLKVDAKELLEAMGMHAPFEAADFSGITTDEPLQITDILHQAVLKVDEKGTEAAGATAVVVGRTAIPEFDAEVTLDHPFVFLLRDEVTGTVLFLGRLAAPN